MIKDLDPKTIVQEIKDNVSQTYFTKEECYVLRANSFKTTKEGTRLNYETGEYHFQKHEQFTIFHNDTKPGLVSGIVRLQRSNGTDKYPFFDYWFIHLEDLIQYFDTNIYKLIIKPEGEKHNDS